MTSRCLFLTLVLIGAGCRTPEVKPLLNEPVDLGLANSSARMIALQGCGSWKDLLICTIPEMDESASLRFVEKVVRLGYRSLWVRTPPPADSAAAAALLQAGAARLTTPGKKGVMLFGSWPVCGSALSDTVFQAMIWVTAPGPVQECLGDAPQSAPAGPRLALIIPSQKTVTLEPAWRMRLAAAEDLVWLATSQPDITLLQSDLEPIVRRKTQLFFDRYLKGKK